MRHSYNVFEHITVKHNPSGAVVAKSVHALVEERKKNEGEQIALQRALFALNAEYKKKLAELDREYQQKIGNIKNSLAIVNEKIMASDEAVDTLLSQTHVSTAA